MICLSFISFRPFHVSHLVTQALFIWFTDYLTFLYGRFLHKPCYWVWLGLTVTCFKFYYTWSQYWERYIGWFFPKISSVPHTVRRFRLFDPMTSLSSSFRNPSSCKSDFVVCSNGDRCSRVQAAVHTTNLLLLGNCRTRTLLNQSLRCAWDAPRCFLLVPTEVGRNDNIHCGCVLERYRGEMSMD